MEVAMMLVVRRLQVRISSGLKRGTLVLILKISLLVVVIN